MTERRAQLDLRAEERRHEARLLQKEQKVLQHKRQMQLLKLSQDQTYHDLKNAHNDLEQCKVQAHGLRG